MKYGVSFFSFDEMVDFKEAMRQCKLAGYDGVELVLSNGGNLTMQTSDKELIKLKTEANTLDLEICSIGAWNSWDNNLASPNEIERKRAQDLVKKQIDIAKFCDADVVLVVPGYVGTPFADTRLVSYEVAYDCSQKSLFKLSEYAASNNITIAIENVWNKFLLSPIEMRDFIDEIGSPYVQVYFDIGNIIYIGYPEQWIRILGHRIKRLQFDDCRYNQSGLGMFVDIFAGDVNYEEVMKAVHEIGYDDWAVVEFFPGYKRFQYQSIINARLSLDTIMKIG